MSRALSLAGFQVILIGRFWVTTEAVMQPHSPVSSRSKIQPEQSMKKEATTGIGLFALRHKVARSEKEELRLASTT
jgi:hypothetical protein